MMSLPLEAVLVVFCTASLSSPTYPFFEHGLSNMTAADNARWEGWCGNNHYFGVPAPHKKWDECISFCEESEVEPGLRYYMADATNKEEWDCAKEMMTIFKEHFSPNKTNHYWLGGSRTSTGEFEWLSGEPFTFSDWLREDGHLHDPYIHITAQNKFRWNTKSDEKDRNNGCVCKSYQQ